MAKVKLSFICTDNENELQVFCNTENQIFIGINYENFGELNSGIIAIDIDTAIKFSKEIRKQIAIAKDNIQYQKEQENG